jgi:hypothetical protein
MSAIVHPLFLKAPSLCETDRPRGTEALYRAQR